MPFATPSKFILYQSNSQVLQFQALQDYLTQAYLNTATILGTLIDPNGVPVPECIEVPFVYVPASNGNYNAVFGDENFIPPLGPGYTLVVDASENNSFGHWEFKVEIQARQN